MAILKIKDENGNFIGVPVIQGEKGEDGKMSFEDLTEEQKASLKGETGASGYTPVKGVDYFTEEDKNEIKTYIDEQLGVVENAYY